MINRLAKQYKDAIEKTKQAGDELGKEIVKLLKPVIPDLRYTLGWWEAGVDTLCLWSESRGAASTRGKDLTGLLEILDDCFPGFFLDTPYGVYVTSEEEEEIRELIEGANHETA